MYRKISDFVTDDTLESEKTIAVFSAISDSILQHRVTEKSFSLLESANHITHAIIRIGSQLGFVNTPQFQSCLNAPSSITISEVIRDYRTITSHLIDEVKSLASDLSLEEIKSVYGFNWSVGHGLFVLVKHEIHHRAQIIVALRLLGLGVPDVYGPARK